MRRSLMNRRGRIKAKADPKLVAWSKAVRERDGGECQWPLTFGFGLATRCGSGDSRIDPHHIAPKGRRPDLKYDVDNGICLCRTHHDWVHDHPAEAEKLGLLSSETYELAARRVKI